MNDPKEELINEIVLEMNLDREESNRLKNMLWMKLYNYSIQEIHETGIAVRDETINEQALRMFLVAKTVQGCTKRTLEYYKLVLMAFFRFQNDKPVTEITANDIRYYFAVKKERDGNKDSNINNIRRVLSSFFGWLHEEEYIAKNPILKVKKIKTERRVKKPFTDLEVEKMRTAVVGDVRLSAIFEVLLSTGCRIAEVVGMNKNDLEFDEIVVYGKGKKERIVYLNAKARLALERYLATRKDDNEAMFVWGRRPYNRLSIGAMGEALRMLGRGCGIKDVHPHRFRRTSATIALNRGMPIEQVQIMLGHENIETTTLYAVSAQEAVKASHKKYVV